MEWKVEPPPKPLTGPKHFGTSHGLKLEVRENDFGWFNKADWRLFVVLDGIDIYAHGEARDVEAAKKAGEAAAAKLAALGARNRY